MNVFELYAKIGLDRSEYDEGLNQAKSTASKIGGGISNTLKVGAKAVAATTTAVVGFSATAIKAGSDFDSSMSQVAATMGVTTDEIGELRDFAQEMGSTTAFSATQAADALNYMALAGYDADTSMNMLPNVLNLAAAGGMELAYASDMITDSQSALGLSLDETSELVNKMAKASSKSNTSVSQLGEAILTVGGTAKNLKGGTTELATVLGILADNGVKGSEGGTALRNILNSLMAPTDGAAKKLEELGVSVFDAQGNMRSMNDVFIDLNKSMDGMSQQGRADVISTLFNARDMKSAEALLANVGDRYNELSGYIDDSANAAQAMAETQLDNLQGDITLLKSALEGAQIALSDQLTPSLRDFVKFGSDGLSKLTEAFKSDGLSGAMEAFGKILSDGLAMIIKKIPDFMDAGMKLLGALGQGILDNMPMIMDAAGQTLMQFVEGIIQALPSLVDGAIQMISQLAIFLGEQLPTLIPVVIDMILTIVNGLIDNIDLLVDGAIALITGLAEGLINALPKLIEKAPEIVIKLAKAIIMNAPKILEAGLELINSLVTGIVNAFGRLLEVGKELVDKVKEGFKQKIEDAKNWGKDMIENFVGGIKEKWGKLKDGVAGVANTVKDFLGFSEPKKGPLSNFHTYAPDMMELFTKGIADNEGMLTDQLSKTFDISSNLPIFDNSNMIKAKSGYGGVMSKLEEFSSRLTGGDIVIPVYIGTKQIDEIVMDANKRVTVRSGGKAYV